MLFPRSTRLAMLSSSDWGHSLVAGLNTASEDHSRDRAGEQKSYDAQEARVAWERSGIDTDR